MNRPIQKNMVAHYLHESESWKRLLAIMQTENALLKTRLAAYLKEATHASQLEEAEYFQTLFVNEDEGMALLRRDLALQNKWLQRYLFEYSDLSIAGLKKQEKLRREIQAAEKNFHRLRLRFNRFLTKPGSRQASGSS
jgi:hypothetical protein